MHSTRKLQIRMRYSAFQFSIANYKISCLDGRECYASPFVTPHRLVENLKKMKEKIIYSYHLI